MSDNHGNTPAAWADMVDQYSQTTDDLFATRFFAMPFVLTGTSRGGTTKDAKDPARRSAGTKRFGMVNRDEQKGPRIARIALIKRYSFLSVPSV